MISSVTGTTIFSRAVGALQIFELAAPHDVSSRAETATLACTACLRLGDVAAEIAVADVDKDVDRELPVLGADRGRAARERDLGDLAERHRAAARHRHQHVAGDRLRIAAQVARDSGC